MKKATCLLVMLLCLCSCRLYDKYTGEPFIGMEYTVDGERVEYEDWGKLYGTYSFYALSSGGLSLRNNPNGGEAHLSLTVEHISLNLGTPSTSFTDSRRYSIPSGEDNYYEGVYGNAAATEGWCYLTTKSSEPYCTYEVHFEFTCYDGQNTYRITDGCIRVGRRFQENIKGLIKKSSQQ